MILKKLTRREPYPAEAKDTFCSAVANKKDAQGFRSSVERFVYARHGRELMGRKSHKR